MKDEISFYIQGDDLLVCVSSRNYIFRDAANAIKANPAAFDAVVENIVESEGNPHIGSHLNLALRELRNSLHHGHNVDIEFTQSEPTSPTPLPNPPQFATYLYAAFAAKNSSESQLGDLEEMFVKNAERFGETRARRLYWLEVGLAIMPAVRRLITGIIAYYLKGKIGL